MAIPNYQNIMLPLLQLVSDKNEWSIQNSVERMALHFKLTPSEKKKLLIVEFICLNPE